MQNLIKLSQNSLIEKVNLLKAEIDKIRPISAEQELRIMQKFRLDWNFHSNAIEGNSLSYGETRAFLLYGVTAKGKPFKDYLDIKGHNAAIDFLTNFLKSNDDLTETDIRNLHKMLLVEPYQIEVETATGIKTKKTIKIGQYKELSNHVLTVTGAIHFYATPEETPIKMRELIEWYRETKENKEVHPLVLATIFHHKFVAIHPFDDGNGRMTRLLMNMILMQNSYLPVVIKQQNRDNYYLALSQADIGDIEPFIELIAEEQIRSMEIYLKGAKGENIDEPDDFDKELLIFKKELEGREDKFEVKRNIEVQKELFEKNLYSINDKIRFRLNKLYDLFLRIDESYGSIYFDEDKNMICEAIRLNPIPSFDKINFDFGAFCYEFNEFKLIKNSFSFLFCIGFYFDNYNYSLQFFINRNSNKRISIKKNYNEILTEQEIEEIATQAGKLVLDYIKEKTKE